eukprot:12181018-Prorocentrum_lima.AAC.1
MVKDCPDARRAVEAPVPSPPASVSEADPVATVPAAEGGCAPCSLAPAGGGGADKHGGGQSGARGVHGPCTRG